MLTDIAGGEAGQFMSVLFTAMLPVLELRAAIPLGASLRLPFIPVVLVSIIGNMLPVPFILLLMRHILNWMRSIPRMAIWAEKIETRAHLKCQKISLAGIVHFSGHSATGDRRMDRRYGGNGIEYAPA